MTDRITITLDDAMRTLREVVAEYGRGHRYIKPLIKAIDGGYGFIPACVYTHNYCPSCLIGHVLHRLGVPVGEHKYYNRVGIASLAWDCEYGQRAFFEPEAVGVLERAQGVQDNGISWGAALDAAEEMCKEITRDND